MKFFMLYIITAMSLMTCDQSVRDLTLLSSSGKTAESVYLTRDHLNNPVAVWTEKDEGGVTLVFSISDDDGNSFSNRSELKLDQRVATHAEGMPKIAFKKDGTVVVAYEKKLPTDENKFAGAVYYRTSTDAGRTWTGEYYLHSDTVAGRSRSFFDIESLPDGEIGATWLDVKLNNRKGRSVHFAKTNNNNKFSNEILVDSSACQCCRTELYADPDGRISVAYRGLKEGAVGQTIRDMMIVVSDNSGLSFSSPVRISEDNWNIDGCPHTGPALCSSKGNLQALWYTEGSGMGIYYAHRGQGESDFNSKQLISNFGRHPQSSSNDNEIAVVWEEDYNDGAKAVTQIHCQVNDGERISKAIVSPKENNAFLPVIEQTTSGFVVAFLMEQDGKSAVYLKRI